MRTKPEEPIHGEWYWIIFYQDVYYKPVWYDGKRDLFVCGNGALDIAGREDIVAWYHIEKPEPINAVRS